MAHNSYTRSGGIWNTGTGLLAGEMASLDAKTFAAISGDQGGTWAPSSIITIGGAGLQAGPLAALSTFNAAGISTFAASVVLQDTLQVANAATFNGNVTLGNAAGDTLTVTATSAFASPAVFSSTIVASSTLTATGTLTAQHNAQFGSSSSDSLLVSSTSTFVSPMAVESDLNLLGAGAIVERVVTGTDSTSTYSVSTADLIYIPAGSISAARDYFIDEVAAVNGKKIRFHRADRSSSNPITLKRSSDSSVILTLTWDATGYTWTDLVRISGVWQAFGGFIHP